MKKYIFTESQVKKIIGGEIEKKEFKSEFNFLNKPKYKRQDLLSQEIFAVEFFNWLPFWERHHINQKYKLNLNID